MRITILTSSDKHPIFPKLEEWIKANADEYDIELKLDASEVTHGDFLFLISCSEIVKKDIRLNFKHSLVVHASDLPKGRGWSPHIWAILNGENEITLSLIEAEDKVDTGQIWKQVKIQLEGHELSYEINDLISLQTLFLMGSAIKGDFSVKEQGNESATYCPRRTPEDSEIQVTSTLESAFNLLRVSDPVRYPAFFWYRGHKYKIIIEKV